MAIAAAWVAIAISLIALVRGEALRRSERKHRLAVGPADEIRDRITDLRGVFVELANKGQRRGFFSGEERKHAGQRIRDLADRVTDEVLRDQLGRVASAWDECFQLAPPRRGARVYILDRPNPEFYRRQDAADDDAFHRQNALANIGIESCRKALARLNELDQP